MTKTTSIDWQETLTGEMLLLKTIGRIWYRYPDKEEWAWIKSLIAEEIFSEAPFAAKQEQIKAGLGLLQKWGEAELTDEAFEKIQSDYTRMFIGPGKLKAAPWESVYLNEDRMTFQEQTLDVRYWYRRFGLESEKIHKEPDDHIGLELMFLAHLATEAIQALQVQDQVNFDKFLDAQREFLIKHLGVWAQTWCGLVEKNAQTEFYKGLVALTRGALAELAELFEVKLVEDTSL